MREIIFKGKRVDNGEWVHGYYAKINTDRSIDVFYDEIFTGEMSSDNNGRVDFKRNIVTKETVGQYTGLKDSTGKRIFEGDIVKFKLQDADEYRFAKILYGEFVDENDSQFYLGFYVVGMGCTFSIFNGKDDGYDFIGMCEACGNIHENPELLEAL